MPTLQFYVSASFFGHSLPNMTTDLTSPGPEIFLVILDPKRNRDNGSLCVFKTILSNTVRRRLDSMFTKNNRHPTLILGRRFTSRPFLGRVNESLTETENYELPTERGSFFFSR